MGDICTWKQGASIECQCEELRGERSGMMTCDNMQKNGLFCSLYDRENKKGPVPEFRPLGSAGRGSARLVVSYGPGGMCYTEHQTAYRRGISFACTLLRAARIWPLRRATRKVFRDC